MDSTDLAFAGLARQAALVRAGEVSPRALVELYLDRIERINPIINAFRVVMSERVLAEAEQAEARLRAGDERPLLGVPVAVKDNLDVAGEVTAFGSGAYDGPAQADAEIVRRLRAAGALVIGKTHMSELAIWPFTESATWGVSRNPWSLDRTPGGSSGGSAAAVAAGLVGGAIGSDGGGSVRVPAASCGLFGLKPQRGRIPTEPLLEHWYGLTAFGPLTRTVIDAALLTDILAGNGGNDAGSAGNGGTPPGHGALYHAATAPPAPLRVAVSFKPAVRVPVKEQVRKPVRDTAELLRSLGHDVREAEPDYGEIRPLFIPRYLRGIHDDASAMAYPARLERRTRRMSRVGALVSGAVVSRARAGEEPRARQINRIFDAHDVLISPALARPPLEVGRYEGRGWLWSLFGITNWIPFTPAWNLTGQPAASVPAGFDDDGLPLAVQIVGAPGDEATVLAVAAQIESERPWADRRPPTG
jgi:amidase